MQLLPSQREFLAADALTSNHDTQAVLLTAPAGFDLSAAIEALYQRHDALRLRFAFFDGEWQVEEAPLTAAMISNSCVFETLPEDPKLQGSSIGERCAHYLRSLDITHGPVFRAVHFQSRAEQPGRLFLVAHHLVVDDVSWRVLLRDLDAAYRQTSTGGPSQRDKNSSYQQWAEALTAYATSEVLERERDYWHDNAARKIEPWPVSPLSKDATCYASVLSVPLQLSVADTTALLNDCTATYHTNVNELLLAAVYVALREWSGQTSVRVTLEENGREKLFPQIDVSETVGCFTTRYPLVLNSEAPNLSTVIKSVKEQYRAVPHQGIGYGLLRYVAGDESLKEAEPPLLLFKYQGALNQVMHSVDPHRRRSHALSLSGVVAADALRFKLEYSERQYSQETMQSLVDHLGESLRALIAHSREPEAGYYTPSDFPLVTIEQSTLDEWQTTYAIEQLYPATAMQKGMFFHSLLDQAAYVTQLYSTIEGDVQLPLLRQAWQTVVDRHAMLRTIFIGTGEAQHQLVLKRASLFWQEEDLCGLSADEQNARFEEYRQNDRARGFSPLEAPLMRLSLFRLSQEEYRLLWSHHHSLIDGWAIRLVFGEVMQVYAALNEGVTPVLPPVAEYARYVEWLLKQDQEKASRYWQTYLANVEGVTRLPYDAPGSEHARIHETLEVSLSAADMAQLQVLAKRHHTTVNTLLQLAWGVVLKSYAGEKQVVFGAVLSGRFAEVAEVERMVGLTINSIPVVGNFAGNESLAEPIRRLHSGFQQSQKYAYLPLTEIQKQSRLSKGAPLFESLLVFENFARDLSNAVTDDAASIRIGEFGAHLQDTYPLVLSMFQGESLQVTCRYFGDLFGAATVRRMLDQFIYVLQQLPQCQTVTEIKLLSNDAARQQLQEWNDTEREYGRERSIAAVFEEQVRERPEAIAVVIGEQSLTHAELNQRANQLGHYLRELGVGPELCVGVCVDRSLEMILGMLGILKAGGAYVPLDPGYPTERLAYMLRDAGVVVVLTQESLLDSLPSHWGQVVSLDGEWEEIATRSTADVVSEATGENLAYVMYTSGSTGEPKGTAIVQRAVVRLVKQTDYAEFGPAETFVQMAPLTFDASTFEVWGSLLNGAQLVVLEPGTPTLEELGAALRRYEVSTLWLTAGLFHLVVNERPEELRGLKQLLAGGDVLSATHVSKALQWLDGGSLINGYGPTENTTFSCCRRFYREDEIGEVVSIGRPIANTQAYVLDEHLGLLPVGGNGELYLGGDGLARSYYNRAELTAERFVPHPFARRAGERLYRTGDVVRYRANGEIEFVGRRDAQVKVRGFRIELGEIEAVLAQHEQVRDAVAMVREAQHGDKQLVAYVVGEASVSELQRYLKEKLPKYMAPQAIVKLEQLPLTASGKVDRKALPSPERTGDDAEEVGYVAPRTAEEELLAGVWAEVLGIERVSVHDNFFERGGHSLLATQVISRIRALFQIDLPLRALFDTTTLAELAQLIVRARQEEVAGAGPAIERRSRETAPALSYAQQRLWFLDQFEPGSAVYNVPAAIRLIGELDQAALERSLSEIARRHEVLRTTYPSVGGQPVQHIAPPSAVDLPLIELQGLKEEDKGSAVRELAAAEAARPFDLAHGPLWRTALMRLSEHEHVLLLTMYHIVTDGWSVGVLIHELTTLYEAYSRAEESPLPELKIQYADFAEWQREWLRGPVLEEQMSYWREQLAGSSGVLELPTDHARSAVQSYRGATQTIQFSEELTRGLRELSRREGVTLFMTLLSGWQTLLARYSGQWDLNIGTPIANRTRSEVEELIGFFVNTLVLRTELQPRMSFREHLLRVREVCLGAYAHQDVPFEMVVEELQPERDMGRSPLFQVMFVLQNAPLGELQLPGLKLEPLEVEQQTAKFELTLTLMETDTGLVGWCNYRTELFDEPTITRLLEHWRVLLQAALEDPTQPLSELPLLTEAEREQVLVQWNETGAEYPRESCIHELFEQQVQQTPAATAVHFGGEQLSYRELNARANQLAHYLREQGVGAGEPVGLCVERSLEMVIGILGVLKAGGGYVPIDPDYPRERVAQMLSDSGIRLLLAQQHLNEQLPEHSAQVVNLDSDWQEIAQYPLTNPPTVTTTENLAYMIYTSGSTGRPKGVMVPHRALNNHMAWMQRRFPLAPTDRVIQKTPFSFDASVWELFAPLLIGARLVIAAPGGHQDLSYLVRFIREQQITALKIVPSLLEPLLQEPRIEECASLRYVFCGAEAMPPRLPEKFVQRLDAELFNLYGPTETAIDVTYWKCETGTGRRSIPIGWPITNTQVYVLDEGMR
ncbi:MAG TPA: amino acid adenylation domain-containing protein, partial [Pyrinomonadaceae bacterium]